MDDRLKTNQMLVDGRLREFNDELGRALEKVGERTDQMEAKVDKC